MPVLYGGSDSLINKGTCKRCDGPIDRHAIPFIRPDDSTPLLNAFKDTVYRFAKSMAANPWLASKYQDDEGPPATMLGAAVVTLKNRPMQYVTISGASAGTILPHLDRQGLPKEVVLIRTRPHS